jgi:hypothetical protein
MGYDMGVWGKKPRSTEGTARNSSW